MVPYSSNLEVFAAFLKGCGANTTSQFGEDGIIEVSLEEYGADNRWCFEVGANDGLFFSNTHRLRCAGWNAVLIESDPILFGRLCEQRSETVQCIHEKIGRDSLDSILARCGAPSDIDFGVIDIDGQDYWAWEGMRTFRPRLMLVEFEYGTDGEAFREIEFIPEINGDKQASFAAIKNLGEAKGYAALAKTTVNLLFVKTELL